MMTSKGTAERKTAKAKVYCPICTHTVDASVRVDVPKPKVVGGQRCARCSGSIDAGMVLYIPQAA